MQSTLPGHQGEQGAEQWGEETPEVPMTEAVALVIMDQGGLKGCNKR